MRHWVTRRLVVAGETEEGREVSVQISLGWSAAGQYNLSKQAKDRSSTRSRCDYSFLRKHRWTVVRVRPRVVWSGLLREVRDDESERGRNAA